MYVNSGQLSAFRDGSLGQTGDLCQAPAKGCFKSAMERDSVRTMCQYGTTPKRMPGPCPDYVIGPDDVYRVSPCDVAHFGLCSSEEDPSGQIAHLQHQQQQSFGPSQQEDGSDEKESKDKDATMFYVASALGLAAIGGIAYFMMKRK